jgi:hypothetical protein
VRSAKYAAVLFLTSTPLLAQVDDTPPPGLAAVEIARSSTCVGTLARIREVDSVLGPMADASRRLQTIAQAVAVEDPTIVASLATDDPVEEAVRVWFLADAALAQRYLAEQSLAIAAERTAARDVITATLDEKISGIQADANVILDNSQELAATAGPCDGAIFVRSAVLEACQSESGPICTEAALAPTDSSLFRFVDAPESMWDLQELRPWTTPSALGAGPSGQLEGARTIGYARVGNVAISVAFSPLLKDRGEATPAELQSYLLTNDSLGLTFDHPDLAFAPAIGVRASLPVALAEEAQYIVHFGDPLDPDIVWSGAAGTGQPIEATVTLSAAHVTRLQAGDAITFTALTAADSGGASGLAYTIELTNVNQAPATQALLEYMANQMVTDLSALVRPRGGP